MKPVVIFDLDGTLANMEHRVHWAKVGNWEVFFSLVADDTPIAPMCNLAATLLSAGVEVHIWTGRSEVSRNDTLWWIRSFVSEALYDAIVDDPARLRMRTVENRTQDDTLKRRWWQKSSDRFKDRVEFVVEDRDRVVDMWRQLGVVCLQCAPGKF